MATVPERLTALERANEAQLERIVELEEAAADQAHFLAALSGRFRTAVDEPARSAVVAELVTSMRDKRRGPAR